MIWSRRKRSFGAAICGHCGTWILPGETHSCPGLRAAMAHPSGYALPREPLRVPMPGRKRWPAIELHYRLLKSDGRLCGARVNPHVAQGVARYLRKVGVPIVALIKVTPK
jgi:hypothetical protein